MSIKRKEESVSRTKIREECFSSGGYRCILDDTFELKSNPLVKQLGYCGGILTPHHIKKSGQGGKYEIENLLCLCLLHNDAVEDHPDAAHQLGLVMRSGETLQECADKRKKAGLSQ